MPCGMQDEYARPPPPAEGAPLHHVRLQRGRLRRQRRRRRAHQRVLDDRHLPTILASLVADLLARAVALAPRVSRVRVWQITSWGRGPQGGGPLPEGLVLARLSTPLLLPRCYQNTPNQEQP